MASINSKNLTQDQRDAVKKAIRSDDENLIDELLSKLQNAYRAGYKTKEQFLQKLGSTSSYKSLETSLAERIFTGTDLDHSGTTDFYELLMAMTLIESNDPETKLKWLFTLCDLDRDGLVNQADVTEVLTILMIFGSADPTSAQPDETTVEQTKNEIGKRCKESVENIFADKAPLNTEQFRQGFEEREANFFDELVRLLSACFVDAVI